MESVQSFLRNINPLIAASRVDLLKRVLKIYGLFAALNVLVKIYGTASTVLKLKSLWKRLPGWDMDIFAKRFRERGDEFQELMHEISIEKQNHDLVKLDLPVPALMFNTPDAVQWILKDEFEHITKPGQENDYLFELMNEFLGKNGIFVLQHGAAHPKANEMWHKERKVSSLIFTKANFETIMYETFIEKGFAAQRKIARVSPGSKFDIQELFFSYTMDSIEKFFFGNDVNTVEGGMSNYAKNFDTAHQNMIAHVQVMMAVVIATQMLLPYPFGTLSLEGLQKHTIVGALARAVHPSYQIFRGSVQKLGEEIRLYVKQTRADPNLKMRKDIIANFLNSKIGDELTDEMLSDIVLSLTIAGRDTTACTLSWMVYELTLALDVQEKLCAEIDEKLPNGKVPTPKDINIENMPYLNGVIYEALRMHPAVPLNQKFNDVDLVYKDGTIIPKGTALFFSTAGINRNATRYPNPDKFLPERWIPFNQPSLFDFPVFQAGPRFCLGKDMAQFEMKLLVCMIFQKFRFTLLKGEKEKIRPTPMLTPSISNHPEAKTQNLWVVPEQRT